ncbi:MAG TPA: helix-turn-helix transcriptional regulator [Solirubrobacterales bacterium]|nr:helix-turn-helix transcriptional regulator [Solirubrobacterales bacterium]
MSPGNPKRRDPSVALGQAIRALRHDKGITQEELALKVEVHPTYISMIEAGRRNVTWGTVRRISLGLGVSLRELVDVAEEIERQD